jgi:hypothetical protein
MSVSLIPNVMIPSEAPIRYQNPMVYQVFH